MYDIKLCAALITKLEAKSHSNVIINRVGVRGKFAPSINVSLRKAVVSLRLPCTRR